LDEVGRKGLAQECVAPLLAILAGQVGPLADEPQAKPGSEQDGPESEGLCNFVEVGEHAVSSTGALSEQALAFEQFGFARGVEYENPRVDLQVVQALA
ncbi:MAG: hypothetical protein ACLFV0_06280, partial [Nitriliruptoraceae bacterium]